MDGVFPKLDWLPGLISMQILTPSQSYLVASERLSTEMSGTAFNIFVSTLVTYQPQCLMISLKVEKAYVQIKFIKFGAFQNLHQI